MIHIAIDYPENMQTEVGESAELDMKFSGVLLEERSGVEIPGVN